MRNIRKSKGSSLISIIVIVIYVLAIIGEVRCIYKAATANWDPVGKAEIIYTASALSGLGAIVGWINIEDE